MIITLLTDFGTQDTYVGVMKGVIKGIAPDSELIDLTHDIPPQDIAAGAFALKTAYRYFPPGTIHLTIVDPGVGSTRHPIAARIGDYTYVCPNNGLLSYVMTEDTLHAAVILDHTQFHHSTISRTFHGRDIFAPVAAHLANGVPLDALGTALNSLTTFPVSHPDIAPQRIICHAIYRDVYGNVLTDLPEAVYNTWEATAIEIRVGEQTIPGPMASYSAVPTSKPLALFGSSGNLEIAVRNGNAAIQLGLHIGDTVTIHRQK